MCKKSGNAERWGWREAPLSLHEPHHKAPHKVHTGLTLSPGKPPWMDEAPQSWLGCWERARISYTPPTQPCHLHAADRCLYLADNMAGGMLAHAWQHSYGHTCLRRFFWFRVKSVWTLWGAAWQGSCKAQMPPFFPVMPAYGWHLAGGRTQGCRKGLC